MVQASEGKEGGRWGPWNSPLILWRVYSGEVYLKVLCVSYVWEGCIQNYLIAMSMTFSSCQESGPWAHSLAITPKIHSNLVSLSPSCHCFSSHWHNLESALLTWSLYLWIGISLTHSPQQCQFLKHKPDHFSLWLKIFQLCTLPEGWDLRSFVF